MKKLLLIGTGGTIACSESAQGLVPFYSADQLLAFIPDYSGICSIDTIQLSNIDSTNIRPDHWIKIANMLYDEYELYDGFVITHGTDTMAYTAAAISYILQGVRKPVVFTGSQKPIEAAETDGIRNLSDSILFACENNEGIFVVFSGHVINGSRAVKLRTKSYNAFESINCPDVAVIENGIVKYNTGYTCSKANKPLTFLPLIEKDVALIKLMPGIVPDIFDYIGKNYRGVVVESFGSGGVPFLNENNVLAKIEGLVKAGIIVVITTQCLFEGGNLDIYEAGKKIMENRIIPAYDMTTEAAVTKLMWALAQANDFETVKNLFLTPINNDISCQPA